MRNRGLGILLCALFGGAWAYFAARSLTGAANLVALAVAAVIGGVLARAGFTAMRAAQTSPPLDGAARAARDKAWRWFWFNFLAEMVLINLVVWGLGMVGRSDYWTPAITLVVGLHFFPLRSIFGVPAYGVVGALMCLCAVVGIAGLALLGALPGAVASSVAFANALILWGVAARDAFGAGRDPGGA